MKDNRHKFLYFAGISLIMALSSLAYAIRTYQVLGDKILKNSNGQLFIGGTIVFSLAAVVMLGLHIRSKKR